eukprot:1113076-Amphidinium_carterae.1
MQTFIFKEDTNSDVTDVKMLEDLESLRTSLMLVASCWYAGSFVIHPVRLNGTQWVGLLLEVHKARFCQYLNLHMLCGITCSSGDRVTKKRIVLPSKIRIDSKRKGIFTNIAWWENPPD